MNRKQLILLGLICLIAAFVSVDVGSRYSGIWFDYLAMLCPSLLAGSYLIYLCRDKALTPDAVFAPHGEWPYLVAIMASLLLLAIGLLALGH